MADVDLKLRAENRALARRIDALESMVKDLALTSQMSRSTVDIDGSPMPLPRAVAAGVEAVGLAGQALESANGKNRVIYSDVAPDVVEGMVLGDVWWQRDEDKRIVGQWQFDGTIWVATPIDGAILANIDAGSITFGTMRGIDFEAVNIRGSVIDGADVRGEGFSVRGDDGSVLLKIAKEGLYVFPKGYWDEVPGEVAASPGGSMQVIGAEATGFALRLNRFQPVGTNLHWRHMEIGSRNHPNASAVKPAGSWEHADGGVDASAERASFASVLAGAMAVIGNFFANVVEAATSMRSPVYQNPLGQPSAPYAYAAGSYSFGSIAGNASETATLTFPSNRFTRNPIISVVGNSTRFRYSFNSLSSTSVNLTVVNDTAGASTLTVHWTATQMTAASGSG